MPELLVECFVQTKLQPPWDLMLPHHHYLEVLPVLHILYSKFWSRGLNLMLLSLGYLSVFFSWFKVDSFLLLDKSSLIYSSNFWVPFTLWGIGLVVSIFSRASFSDIWVDIYLFIYEANRIGKFHSCSAFSGSNSNLQYLDNFSFDWSGCFLLPPLDWISVGLLTWSPLWPPLDWSGVSHFTSLDLRFSGVLCWNVGDSTKDTRKHYSWVSFKVSLSCTWGYSARDL